MGLKDKWVDKIDNEDYVVAEDINGIAHSIIDIESIGLEKGISGGSISIENNIAGSLGFRITASGGTSGGTGTYTLDGYESGYEVGDIYTVRIQNYYDRQGTITAIDGNAITVDNFIADTLVEDVAEDSDANTFRVADKPEVGNVDIGICAVALGDDNIADGRYSTVLGYDNRSNGKYSAAFGHGNRVQYGGFVAGQDNEISGQNASAIGRNNTVNGHVATALGENNAVNGLRAFAANYGNAVNGHAAACFGQNNTVNGARAAGFGTGVSVSGMDALGFGQNCVVSGNRAFGFGIECAATQNASAAGGWRSEANYELAWAFGSRVQASARAAAAFGQQTRAVSAYQFVCGQYNEPDTDGEYVFIAGNGTSDTARSNAFAVRWDGGIDVDGVTVHLGNIDAALDSILALQESLIGGAEA